MLPMYNTQLGNDENELEGVIAISMDMTETRQQEEQLKEQEKENSKLLANEAAAKAASKMKSQFLANVRLCYPIVALLLLTWLLDEPRDSNTHSWCDWNERIATRY
jgi:hypothetical protein